MNITKISINRPSLIIVLFSVFVLIGYIGFKNLSYELLPDFNQPVIVVKTVYPGAEPEEVETSVSKKLEDALSNLEGIDYIQSKSLPNASIIIANLKYGTDVDFAMQDAQRQIDNIRNDLPEQILSPTMSKVSPSDLPIMSISATSDLPATEFYQKITDEYLPQIKQLKGVAEIDILGGEQREIQVKVDPDKLKLHKVSLSQVATAINMAGKDIPAGKIKTNNIENSVRLVGKFHTIEDIKNVQIAMPAPGSPIYVKDVADVVDGIKDIASLSRFNGVEGLGLVLKKQGDANAVDVSELVTEKLKEIEKENKESNLKFIIADDSTDKTVAAVESVVDDLILAVILVSIVMLLFLRSYRNAIIVIVAIPTSLVTAFGVMWILGFTLNLMTLLAMSLIIGILVDDATVVLENIQRHLDMGKEKRTAAFDGRMEIGYSAIAITLVDVVVFLPILFLQVFVADMLKEFSVVVITSTLTSLLVGFTLTPWMASRIGKAEDIEPTNLFNKFLIWFEEKLTGFINGYANQLKWVLNHKAIFGVFMIITIALTGVLMKQNIIGNELIATGDQGKFSLFLEYDKHTPLQQNNIVSSQVERFLLQQKEVASVFSNIGGPSASIGGSGVGLPYKTEFTIQLVPEEKREGVKTERFMIDIRESLRKEFPGIKFSMTALGLVARSSPIEITLSGSDLKKVEEVALQMKKVVEDIPGADNVQLSVTEGTPELKVIPDNDKMQRLGLTGAYVGLNLRTAFTGNDDATLTDKGTEYPVRIWLDKFDRQNYEDVVNLDIINPKGIPVKISQFATVEQDKSASMLERMDRQPSITITGDALGRPSGSVADDFKAYIKSHPLPEGIQMAWGSDIKKQNDSFGAMANVLLISFILIYLLLVALYDSFIYPIVVMFAIPAALIGALLALNLSMSSLSLFALLGLIMLMGLVVKNSILIVDFAGQLKARGLETREALIEAGKERMRPILMTTFAMVIGMIPIAIAKGTASEWKNGLAWVIIGGLLSSLMLTVYLVPVIYYLVDVAKAKLNKLFAKK